MEKRELLDTLDTYLEARRLWERDMANPSQNPSRLDMNLRRERIDELSAKLREHVDKAVTARER